MREEALTLFPQHNGSLAFRVLMLMHKAQGMAKFVENNASFLGGDEGRLYSDPTQVHSGFIGSDSPNFLADVRP